MAKIVNAWTEWDPLKLVIMGRPEGTNIPAPEPCWWYDLPEGGYPLGAWGPFPQEMVDAALEGKTGQEVAKATSDQLRQDTQAYYRKITAEGEARIADEADTVAALQARLTSMAVMRERTDAAPVRRAMQNLKTAIFDRLSQDRVDREMVLRVAELIDDAARKIERIDV